MKAPVSDDCDLTPRGRCARPDGIPGSVFRACTDQLASVFTDIFNLSLSQLVILTCFKLTTIVPVPKNSKVTCLDDYHHVALLYVIMKCFERVVMAQIAHTLLRTICFVGGNFSTSK
jgi:hypothetical protein